MKKIYSLMIDKRITSFITCPLKMFLLLTLGMSLPFCQKIFTLSAQIWMQVGNDIDGETEGDFSSWSISQSADGKRVAIGAYGNDGNGNASGHVRLYIENQGVWSQMGGDFDGVAEGDYAGWSVSLSANGKRMAIGSSKNDGNGLDAGHIRVFSENGGLWSQSGSDINGESAEDWAGRVSFSDDGMRLAIGSPQNDGNGNAAGHVRVFQQIGDEWIQVGEDIDGESAEDRSGYAISMSEDGKTLAIGGWLNDGNGTNAGHVRVFSENGGVWTQKGEDIDGGTADDRFGYTVSLSDNGKILAIGTWPGGGIGTGIGYVRVYSENAGTWTQIGTDIQGEAPGDFFGHSVSLSGAGNRLVIGASGNDNNGNNSGHARVYSENGGTWTQLGNDIEGESADDLSGWTVSISSDGTQVAIGAVLNDGNGINAGHVRIYKEMPLDVDNNCYDNAACGGTNQKLEIFPNPVVDQLQLHYEGEINEICLISSQGFTKYTFEKVRDLHQINIQQIPSGLYALMVRIDDKWIMKKFIKQ
jgi:hypothetical protein